MRLSNYLKLEFQSHAWNSFLRQGRTHCRWKQLFILIEDLKTLFYETFFFWKTFKYLWYSAVCMYPTKNKTEQQNLWIYGSVCHPISFTPSEIV